MEKYQHKIFKRILEISTICQPEHLSDITGYAKAAIRDVFIQMPTRTVREYLMPSYLNQIASQLGEEQTAQAWKDLQSEGWVTLEEGKYCWKRVFGPVNPGHSERDKINESINESPDTFLSKALRVTGFNSPDTYITFGYINNICYVGNIPHPYVHEDFFGDIGDRDSFKYPGRLWPNEEVISFWKYPRTSTEVRKIIKDAGDHFKMYNVLYYLNSVLGYGILRSKDNKPTSSYRYFKNAYDTMNIDIIYDYINETKLPDKNQTLRGIKVRYEKNYIGNPSKYSVEIPGYYRDWDELHNDFRDLRDFYRKIDDDNMEAVLVPLPKYKK